MFEPISYTLWASDPASFAEKLGRSFRETGFAVVADHTIPDALISQTLTVSRQFFALPDKVKARYHVSGGGGQRGYTAFGTENAKGRAEIDLKEFWHTGRKLPPGSPLTPIMPPTPRVREVADFDSVTQTIFETMDGFGSDILRAIALYLKLDEGWFSDKTDHGNSILRLLHYPPQLKARPEGSVRAAAHEDINVITLLLGAEEAGLEVMHRSGEWLSVNPPPGAIVINIGDMLQRSTAGYLPSTTHRVVNPAPERAHMPRYSMPFFLHFNPEYVIRTLPGFDTLGGNPAPPITAQAYLYERLVEIGLVRPG